MAGYVVDLEKRTLENRFFFYTPPEHPQGTVHKNKADAVAAEAQHHH